MKTTGHKHSSSPNDLNWLKATAKGYDVDYNLIAKSKVSEIKKEHNLDDPFRTKYPQKKNGFTFETKKKIGKKKGQLQKARLDFFLVSKKLLPQIDSVSIEKENLSDSDTETNLSDSDTKTNLSDSDTETNLSDSNTFEPNFSDHFQNSLKTIFVSSHILPEDQNLCRMQINHNEKWILTENSECGVQKLQLLPSKYHEDLDGGLYDMSSTKSDSQITSLRGIHVTHNGDVLVGSYDKKNKRNSIIRLSSKGEFLKEMYTQSNVFFHRITENVNCDILAIVKQAIVKLLVLDREGRYRFEYSGPKKMKNTFKPRAVVCSVSGHIFIADKGSKCIHLLDKDGKFIQFFLRENVKFPRELALSDSGTLSIGYSNGEIADYYCYMCFSTICV
ncbi:hypothetical protein KUTeg_014769 [Tegillarca granosa]|uniref:Uncharacterized protein n=1 Tax=Tegillarca granosa TaxID=220873 RepID=A0ABQ9EVF3_TEGGR|nr:hypothetical protein KUTeg_014769 [Tegillarca granosa]